MLNITDICLVQHTLHNPIVRLIVYTIMHENSVHCWLTAHCVLILSLPRVGKVSIAMEIVENVNPKSISSLPKS